MTGKGQKRTGQNRERRKREEEEGRRGKGASVEALARSHVSLSMVTGRRTGCPPGQQLRSSIHPTYPLP
eukprot:764295-Hanusia_phi.AAC.8